MNATKLDLDALASELGIPREQVAAHIDAAIAAGLLRVADASDDDTVVLEGVLPGECP